MGSSVLTASFRRTGDSNALDCEGVALSRIADAVGTPVFVYSVAEIRLQYEKLATALAGIPHRIHYSVKANSSLGVLTVLRELGAGVDIVSGGELQRALLAGFTGDDVVFSGVGKTALEIRQALRAGVRFFNVESEGELRAIDVLAGEDGVIAPVAIRVNPEVDVDTPHEYTRTGGRGHKFGIPYDEAEAVSLLAMELPNVRLVGLDMHVGSQMTRMAPYEHGVTRLLELVERLRPIAGVHLRWLDLGGGLAVPYDVGADEVDLDAFAEVARQASDATGLEIVIEPGRFVVANAGVLVTRVLYRKRSGGKDYVIVDAGMTELLRPSHYQAHHGVERVEQPPVELLDSRGLVDVVGPVCESGDFLALDRELGSVEPGDLLAILSAGAYGYVMASNYNSRQKPPEVLVDGNRFGVVTDRESIDDLTRLERTVPAWRE